jgi:hypothetical protein
MSIYPHDISNHLIPKHPPPSAAGDVMLSDASTGMKQLLKSGAKFEAWWCRWGWQGW